MNTPPALGALETNATLGLALATGWLVVFGVGVYQYRRARRSRERVYMIASVTAVWLAFSLVQVAPILTGGGETAVVAIAVALLCVGVATGVRWWQRRNGEAGQHVEE